MDGTIEDYASTLSLINRLTDRHLMALERFRSRSFPGRALSRLEGDAVNLPGFGRRNRIDDGLGLALTEAEPFEPKDRTRTVTTCAIVRSLIRNPGLPFANIRPLQLLCLWRRELQDGRLTPDILDLVRDVGSDEVRLQPVPNARNYFALGQLAVTARALLQAIPDGEIQESPEAAHIWAEALYRLRKDATMPEPGSWQPADWRHLRYGLQRFVVLDQQLETSVQDEAEGEESEERNPVLEALVHVDGACRRQAAEAASAEAIAVVEAIAAVFKDDPLEAPDTLQRWLLSRKEQASQADQYHKEGTGKGYEHRYSRGLCWAILLEVAHHLAAVPEDFSDLKLDGSGPPNPDVLYSNPPHPYVLYWTLEGIDACERAFEDVEEWASQKGVDLPRAFPSEELRETLANRRRSLVRSATPAAFEVLTQALQDDAATDCYRLGYHLVVAMKYGPEEKFSSRTLRAGMNFLAGRSVGGSWPKRDRFFLTRQGEAFGYAPELATSLLLAVDSRPELRQPLSSIVKGIVDILDEVGTPHSDSAGRAWATRLDSSTTDEDGWATGEAYSMLFVAQGFFAADLARQVQKRYGGPTPRHRGVRWRDLGESDLVRKMDGDIWDDDWTQQPGKLIGERLAVTLCRPLRSKHGFFAEYNLSGRAERSTLKRSGIIYGPPGTGKTTLVEALADFLGWPLITLDPADFLEAGPEGVASTARRVFRTIGELRDAVVFMDEMEELVRHRTQTGRPADTEMTSGALAATGPGDPLSAQLNKMKQAEQNDSGGPDVLQRLWTTTFLTLLQQLHDRANVIFLMATNHYDSLDPAITRAGRFDFRLNLLPPSPPRKWQLLGSTLSEHSGFLSGHDIETVVGTVRQVTQVTGENMVLDGHAALLAGPVMTPQGTRVDDVAHPLRFAFMTWADVRNLSDHLVRELVGDLKAGRAERAPRQPTADRVREILRDEFLPVGFSFNRSKPSDGTFNLDLTGAAED